MCGLVTGDREFPTPSDLPTHTPREFERRMRGSARDHEYTLASVMWPGTGTRIAIDRRHEKHHDRPSAVEERLAFG